MACRLTLHTDSPVVMSLDALCVHMASLENCFSINLLLISGMIWLLPKQRAKPGRREGKGGGEEMEGESKQG